ncbi:juvenile hormone esterase binding protein [Penaeus vannamei]|uniref:Juvenile hormone esterase binding protein n=1 Tax=Penaeus vannamei TaxID=6689 RepID=A0A423TYV1_PENVA|nr:juvenile hormone esterase binding protein [Penaeus vannamei]
MQNERPLSQTSRSGFVPRSLLVNRQLWLAGVTQDRGYRSGRSRQDTSHEDETPQPQNISPQLMDFPWVIWPSLWHTIRNWIFANLIIRPYLDREFSLSTFKAGAIQALVHVSQELAKGNFSALEGLIISSSMEEVKRNFAKLSLKQRLDLGVVAEDIFFSFPYQIGVIFTSWGFGCWFFMVLA